MIGFAVSLLLMLGGGSLVVLGISVYASYAAPSQHSVPGIVWMGLLMGGLGFVSLLANTAALVISLF
jgi:hypothetical protein